MRTLISFLSRSLRKFRGAPEPQSRFHPTAPRVKRDPSGTPSDIVLSLASLRSLLLFATITGGGCWLIMQDWSTDGAFEFQGSGESLQIPRTASLLDLSWSADGMTFLSRSVGHSNGGSPLLLHRLIEQGAAISNSTRPISTPKHLVWNALLLPDASAVVVVDESRIVSRIDLESGVRTELVKVSAPQRPPALAVASDGSSLAVAFDGDVRLFDPRSGQELLRLAGHDSNIADLVFSEVDRWVASGYGDGTIRIWHRTTGALVHHLSGHKGPVAMARFVNGGRHLASAGMQPDRTLRLWNLESGELLWQVAADSTGLHALAVSTDGRLVATGGHDNEIVLWDLNERIRLRACSTQAGIVKALQFSPNGTTLTSASSDGTICIWDVDSTELLSAIDVGTIVGEPESRP